MVSPVSFHTQGERCTRISLLEVASQVNRVVDHHQSGPATNEFRQGGALVGPLLCREGVISRGKVVELVKLAGSRCGAMGGVDGSVGKSYLELDNSSFIVLDCKRPKQNMR